MKNKIKILSFSVLAILIILGCMNHYLILEKTKNADVCPITSDRIKADILLSESVEYGFLNFTTRFFKAEDYIEPLHGEGVPDGWCALGGTGICSDGFAEYANFQNGKLVAYTYQDNHMSAVKIDTMISDQYSGCLYQYIVDLYTAPEISNSEAGKKNNKYWVWFYTDSKGTSISMMYFACDYFSENEVRSIFN